MSNDNDYYNVAEVGDIIKAYDFKPSCKGDPKDHFLIGQVTSKGNGFFKVNVLKSPMDEERVGSLEYVPFAMLFNEWDGRVSKVA